MQVILVALFAVVAVFLGIIGGALGGAFAGWIVGSTFLGDWILDALSAFSVTDINMVDFGTLIGFVGGFIRAAVGQLSGSCQRAK